MSEQVQQPGPGYQEPLQVWPLDEARTCVSGYSTLDHPVPALTLASRYYDLAQSIPRPSSQASWKLLSPGPVCQVT